MHHTTSLERQHPAKPGRVAGIAIALAAIVSTIAVAMDQGPAGHDPMSILQGIAALQQLKGTVHAIAMAAIVAMAFGFSDLARRLGLARPPVLAGLVLYLSGCLAMLGATLLDGFVIPHIAADAIHAKPERAAFAYDLIHYAFIVLDDAAKLGWVLQACGTLGWSLALLQARRFERVIGAVGMVSSGLVIALVVLSDTYMSMFSLLAILVAQLLWNLAVAAWLIRRRDADVEPAAIDRGMSVHTA